MVFVISVARRPTGSSRCALNSSSRSNQTVLALSSAAALMTPAAAFTGLPHGILLKGL